MAILWQRCVVPSPRIPCVGRGSSISFRRFQQVWDFAQNNFPSSQNAKLRASRGNVQASGGQSSRKRSKKNDPAPGSKQESAIDKARIILKRKRKQQEGIGSSTVGELTSAQLKDVLEVPSLDSSDISERPSSRLEDDELFESRLQSIRRSVVEQKQREEEKKFRPIDYDAPSAPSEGSPADNIVLKIGVGVAVVVFGFIFAVGDFLPSVRPPTEEAAAPAQKQLPPEVSARLNAQIQELEATLKDSPEDKIALQKVARAYSELGEYQKAIPPLEKLTRLEPGNVEVWCLLGDSQRAIGEYKLSAASYTAGINVENSVSVPQSFALVQGLTDALISDNNPSEAVSQLLSLKAKLESTSQIPVESVSPPLPDSGSEGTLPDSGSEGTLPDSGSEGTLAEKADLVDIDLLLGKAYVAWDHTGDAIAVYERLISTHPDDFRGFLAKAILLNQKGKSGEAERMFIQARYLAPTEAKGVVDRFSSRGR